MKNASYQNSAVLIDNEVSNVRFSNTSSDGYQKQSQVQDTNQLELVAQRNSQMRDLERDIVDLNSMFVDLSELVHEQGDLVGENAKFNKLTNVKNHNNCFIFFFIKITLNRIL
jgi:hypothetical protein